MGDMDGLCIAVTGAAGNLGAAVCAQLLRYGASVFGIDRQTPRPGFVAALPGGGKDFASAVAQLADEAQVEAAFARCEERFGSLWALVNLAGAWEGGKPAHEAGLAVFDRMIDANLRSAYTASRAAMRRLIARKAGRIVSVSALSAVSGRDIAGSAAYAAAKLGVVGLTRALAEEGAQHGVRANCIAPGTLRTQANIAAMPGSDPSRWLPLEEVADAIAFLCGPGSAAVNGAVLPLPSGAA